MTYPEWRKSSRSTSGTTGDCVEVAALREGVGVRDSKAPGAGHLLLSRRGFADLMARFKQNAAGE
ncbi:DUF397 domain-containing protein [Actinomadura madurae]|uniref:DUF397 domain-containing protein n=1 Tax=Actinomadura madurae TaxID=1993 RepID=UPI000D8C911F|nr:DUF397 domain-containing protein [Actinomadura madurae]SPT50369.1 Domain of uncharacterised function (DUF397) [Actinomadura madurae]